MKLFAISAFFLCVLNAQPFAGCPATVDVQAQKLVKSIPGWTETSNQMTYDNNRQHVLWFVVMYDGEPKEKASLVPDIDQRLRFGWTFARQTRPYWIECHYTRTTVVLSRPIPASVKSCVVNINPAEKLDGHASIKDLVCR